MYQNKILTIAFLGVLALSLLSSAYATKYTDPYTATLEGKYNNKNGIFLLTGNSIFKGKQDAQIYLSGQLKEWNYYDSSIPNCKHAFSENPLLLFDKTKTHYAKLLISGKICSANWSDTWKTFRGNYIITEGKTLGTDQVSGKGIIEFTMNTKSGKTIGLLSGFITLTT